MPPALPCYIEQDFGFVQFEVFGVLQFRILVFEFWHLAVW
jgi:hypothetical protein